MTVSVSTWICSGLCIHWRRGFYVFVATIGSYDVDENIGIFLQYHSSYYYKDFEFLTDAHIAATVQKREFGVSCLLASAALGFH